MNKSTPSKAKRSLTREPLLSMSTNLRDPFLAFTQEPLGGLCLTVVTNRKKGECLGRSLYAVNVARHLVCP